MPIEENSRLEAREKIGSRVLPRHVQLKLTKDCLTHRHRITDRNTFTTRTNDASGVADVRANDSKAASKTLCHCIRKPLGNRCTDAYVTSHQQTCNGSRVSDLSMPLEFLAKPQRICASLHFVPCLASAAANTPKLHIGAFRSDLRSSFEKRVVSLEPVHAS